MENYTRFKFMGGRKKMKPDVVPYIFDCQPDRKRSFLVPSRAAATSTITTQSNLASGNYKSSPYPQPQPLTSDMDLDFEMGDTRDTLPQVFSFSKRDVSIQAHPVTVRSKAVQCKLHLGVPVGLSPIKVLEGEEITRKQQTNLLRNLYGSASSGKSSENRFSEKDSDYSATPTDVSEEMSGRMPGTSLNSQARQFILNLYDYFVLEKENGGPIESLSSVQERVAAALKISCKTVYTIRKRYENNSILCSPGKPRILSKAKTTASPKSPKRSASLKLHNVMCKEGAPDPSICLKSHQFVTKLDIADIKPEPADHPEFVNAHDFTNMKCEVPMCENSWTKTPEKLFVTVPTDEDLQEKWFRLANKDEPPKSESVVYFCEDHFDMPNDMENYMEYQLAGWVPQIQMRPNCVPTKFHCQPDRKRPLADEDQHTGVKRQKCDDNHQSNDVPSEIIESPPSSSTFPTPFTSNVECKEELDIKEELLDPKSPSSLNCNVFNEEEPVIKQESTHSPSTSSTPSDCNIWTVEKVDPKEEAAEATVENNLQPSTKSSGVYEAAYQRFMKWCAERGETTYTENVLLAYFSALATTLKSSSLWSHYSMVKSLLKLRKNVDIERYIKLRNYLRKQNENYTPSKPKVLTKEQFDNFVTNAPDEKYLGTKVVLIMGISGACRCQDLYHMKVEDVQDFGSLLHVKISDPKTNIHRSFTVVGENYLAKYRKYISLRPAKMTERKLFLKFYNGKVHRTIMGIHKLGGVIKEVASYLKLPNWTEYTGHSFKTSAVLLEESGAGITTLKRHRGLKK